MNVLLIKQNKSRSLSVLSSKCILLTYKGKTNTMNMKYNGISILLIEGSKIKEDKKCNFYEFHSIWIFKKKYVINRNYLLHKMGIEEDLSDL